VREIVKRETIGASIACTGGAVEMAVWIACGRVSGGLRLRMTPRERWRACTFYSPSAGRDDRPVFCNSLRANVVRGMCGQHAGCTCPRMHMACSMWTALTKWRQTTRLETRTKESNVYASIWVANPDAE
jgi:hypothetical protein